MKQIQRYVQNIDLLNSEQDFNEVYRLIDGASRLVFIGCGGSLSTCLHMAHDFLKVGKKRTLCPESPTLLSCLFNDYPNEDVFREWLKVQYQPGDLLIAVSSSGNSACTVNAAKYITGLGGDVLTFTAFDDSNQLKHIGTKNVYFPVRSYGIHEIYSEMFLHAILDKMVDENVS